MRKILIIVIIFFSIHSVSNSQVLISLLFGDLLNTGKIEFGLDGGINWSGMTGSDQTSSLRTFNLGFYFDIKLADPSWMVNTGVIVKSTMGTEGLSTYSLNDPELDSMFVGGSVSRELSYFNVPITMKYLFKNNIYVKAGIQLGLFYNAYDTFVKSVNDDNDLAYTVQTRNEYHLIDAGFAVGAGYRLTSGTGINLGVNYYHGVIDCKVDDSGPALYNSVLYVNIGIPIGRDASYDDEPKE